MMHQFRSWALCTALVVLPACASDPAVVTVEEEEEPKPTLVGTVIAMGAFDITPVSTPSVTDPNFLIARRFEGALPDSLSPTAGELLVLSVREVRNALPCPTMVVLEQDGPEPGRRPGRLTVSVPNPITFYPWGDFELRPQAEPI
jgi:hypothetical protein